jgi:hypothetical protein
MGAERFRSLNSSAAGKSMGIFSAIKGNYFTIRSSGTSLNAPNNLQRGDTVKPGNLRSSEMLGREAIL